MRLTANPNPISTLQVSETIKTIRKYEKERTDFLWCGLWIPLGLCVLALLGYLVPVLLSMMIIPAVLLTALLWLIIGIHVPVAITTADFCYGLDQGLTLTLSISAPYAYSFKKN